MSLSTRPFELADPPAGAGVTVMTQPFVTLMWRSSQLLSRAYDAERLRDSAPEPTSPGGDDSLLSDAGPPVVLFHVCEAGPAPPAAPSPPRDALRCPDALCNALRASLPDKDARAAMDAVMDRALQCLAACSGGAASSGHNGWPTPLISVCDDAESSSSTDTAPRVEWPYAYSSEDSAGAPGTGPQRRGPAADELASPQEAQAVLQFLLGAAFSCPCAPLSYSAQLVVARELEGAAHPSKACGGVLRCLERIRFPTATTATTDTATTATTTDTTIATTAAPRGGLMVFVANGAAVEAIGAGEALCGRGLWFARPSPAAALPALVRSVEHPAGARAVRGALSWGAAQSKVESAVFSLTTALKRRNGKMRSASPAQQDFPKACGALGSPGRAPDEVRRRELWSALCGCALLMPRAVAAARRELLYHLFSETGEVPQYYTLLSIHPDLLRAHHSAWQYVFFEEGPLPIADRLMIALMAASRQKCEYLVARFAALLTRFAEKEAKDAAGPVEIGWKGFLLDGPPPHLKAIQRFIALAAHMPWLMTVEEIRTAMAAGWSVPGLMQVVCILAETLSLCSFVMGIFVPNDPWTLAALPASLAERFAECPEEGKNKKSSVEFVRYTGVDEIVSQKRIKGPEDGKQRTIRSGMFNWHEQGGTVMEQYYPGAAALINNEFDAFSSIVRQLNQTDCVGLTSPKYTPTYAFRSLQLYVQNIMGYIADDYQYTNINNVLCLPAKKFAQRCTMHPDKLLISEVRLWSSDSNKASKSSLESSQEVQQSQPPELKDVQEQERQIIDSFSVHKGHFTLTMNPSSGCLSGMASKETDAVDEPTQDVMLAALKLHEERLLLLIALATMEARKEGLLAVLLYPMWLNLNNM